MSDNRWWSKHKLVNGVFKGGGAKGLVYAGALDALDEEGLWFGAVAGTSAGAITASLIAAGGRPDDLKAAVPGLIGSVKRRAWLTMLGRSDAFFDNRQLSIQLEQRYRNAIGIDAARDAPVTFAELQAATYLPLYVVALDLYLKRPVVFSPYTTPGVSVTAAVLASSAIPGAFPSGRAVWRTGPDPVVHRLVDGGAWANYPRFVFEDESFIGWTEQAAEVSLDTQRQRPTVGFALGDELSPSPPSPAEVLRHDMGPREFDEGTAITSSNPALWAIGTALSNNLTRLFLMISLLFVAFATWFIGLPGLLRSLWALLDSDQTGLLPPLIFVLSVLIAMCVLAITTVGLLLVLFGKPLGDVLVPSAGAALAVSGQLPPWLGHADGDHVVLLGVHGLSTTDFAPDPGIVSQRIDDAKRSTKAYLAQESTIAANAVVEPLEASAPPAAVSNPVPTPAVAEGLDDAQGYLWTIIGLVGGGGFAVFGLVAGYAGAVIFGLVVLLGTGLLLAWTSSSYQAHVAAGGRTGFMRGTPALGFGFGAVAVGIAAIGWSAAVAAGREDRNRDEHARVQITSARWLPAAERRDQTGYRYKYEYRYQTVRAGSGIKVPANGEFREDTRFRPSDKVLLEPNLAAHGRLDVLNPNPTLFFMPLIVFSLGLGAIGWGARLLRIRRRDRLLEDQAPLGPAAGAAI